MNDWEIKKFLTVVLAIQLAVWGVLGLDAIGLQIPVIRQLIGFVYLLFIPGVIVLRILKLHKLGNIETLLYSVGLSIATLMFTGLFMNTVYPLFGISEPISITPLVTTISAVVLILCIISYVRDKDFSASNYIEVKEVLSPPALFLCLLPFLSIFGTYLVNFYHNNILLMLLIAVIALIALLIGFNKFIPKNLYPLAVFVIALSLLFHRSLISMYISGYDIHEEYYSANLTKTASYWDSTSPCSLINSMLSITLLAPIASIIGGLSLTWVFKIIYPLVYSLVPLGLYRVFQKQTDDKIAFFSCFFFMSVFHFLVLKSVLLRQQMAELFLLSLILLMIDKRMAMIKRASLSVVLGVSMIVSHITLAYIYMFWLIFAWLILVLAENPRMRKLRNSFCFKFSRHKSEKLASNPIPLNSGGRTLSTTFVLLFVVFALSWYMYVSGSYGFHFFVCHSSQIASNIFTEFLNPEVSTGLQLLLTPALPSLLQNINMYIHHYLNPIFIVIGVLALLFKKRELRFEKEYTVFSILSLASLFAGVFIPFLTHGVLMDRLYSIALIFLAPFCVIGGITVFRMISRGVKISWTNKGIWLKALSVYSVIFFLFQTGFVCQVTQEHPRPSPLSYHWLKKHGDAQTKMDIYNYILLPEQDVFSARWLSMNMKSGGKVYATYSGLSIDVLRSYGMMPVHLSLSRAIKIPKDAYVYLRYVNVVKGIGTEYDPFLPLEAEVLSMAELSHLYEGKNKIYSNGGSEIYR
jgi:uncharacterized membrane protein